MTDLLYAFTGIAFLYSCFRVGGLAAAFYRKGYRLIPFTAVYVIFTLVLHLP